MLKKTISFFLLLLSPLFLWATHNRAGEIIYERIGTGYTYKVTVITFTKESSTQADRDSLVVRYTYIPTGTIVFDTVARVNGPDVSPSNGVPDGEYVGNDIKRNLYVSYHTFNGFEGYIISMQDLNRIGDICNISNSVNEPFYVEDTLFINDPQFYGYNNSPVLQNWPIDYGVANQVYLHNPNAYDPDGDSLHFELVTPKISETQNVAAYTAPNLIDGTVGNPTLIINPLTGELIWDKPQSCCVYNIAILITEYRHAIGLGIIKMGTMVRDMEIIITCDPNRPPDVKLVRDTCVVAGSLLVQRVKSTDPDAGQIVTLTANGGPFVVDAPDTAHFIPDTDTIGYGTFVWQTVCNHVRSQFYQVVFKATDNYPDHPLTDLQNWLIKVVAPAPENLIANAVGNNIVVTWDNPYDCYDAKRFIGFSLWRREGPNPFVSDTCNPTMSGKGYSKIASRLRVYSFTDPNVDRGKEYCYRVEAEFADTTAIGILYSFCEGLPSNEDCAILKKDVPVITNASVRNTDAVNGSMYVAWSKPSAFDLDTLENAGPYEYRVFHSPGNTGANLTQINSYTAPTFTSFIDTTYIDTIINTVANSYSYKIEFYSNGNKIGETEIASSVYVTAIGQDNKVLLSWNENVPWTNSLYTIYKKQQFTSVYDSLGITSSQTYIDVGLINDSTYCYYVRSTGDYSAPGFISPIINLSQRVCAIPIDTIGPCPPTLSISNDCTNPGVEFGPYVNDLQWTIITDECNADLLHYNIYYTAIEGGDFKLVDSTIQPFISSYLHDLVNSVAGCYYITGTDSNYNEGAKSPILCVENCPYYELPNVFTPNSDNQNDLFHPFLPFKYIDKIDIKIYDSWGVFVFETSDPMINWDGVNATNSKMCPDGTYYYVCEVYEQSLAGSVKRSKPLSGFIHLYK